MEFEKFRYYSPKVHEITCQYVADNQHPSFNPIAVDICHPKLQTGSTGYKIHQQPKKTQILSLNPPISYLPLLVKKKSKILSFVKCCKKKKKQV